MAESSEESSNSIPLAARGIRFALQPAAPVVYRAFVFRRSHFVRWPPLGLFFHLRIQSLHLQAQLREMRGGCLRLPPKLRRSDSARRSRSCSARDRGKDPVRELDSKLLRAVATPVAAFRSSILRGQLLPHGSSDRRSYSSFSADRIPQLRAGMLFREFPRSWAGFRRWPWPPRLHRARRVLLYLRAARATSGLFPFSRTPSGVTDPRFPAAFGSPPAFRLAANSFSMKPASAGGNFDGRQFSFGLSSKFPGLFFPVFNIPRRAALDSSAAADAGSRDGPEFFSARLALPDCAGRRRRWAFPFWPGSS